MNPTIQIPQLPPLKPDGNFDTPAVQRFFVDIQNTLRNKQYDDYSGSTEINKNIDTVNSSLSTAITAVGDGIIESGSNSNGRYVKFRDGTLIQWSPVLYSGAINGGWVNYYPALPILFVGSYATYGFCAASVTWNYPISYMTYPLNTTTCMCSIHSSYSQVYNYGWSAIGRWK